jgi:hypothetical protein
MRLGTVLPRKVAPAFLSSPHEWYLVSRPLSEVVGLTFWGDGDSFSRFLRLLGR